MKGDCEIMFHEMAFAIDFDLRAFVFSARLDVYLSLQYGGGDDTEFVLYDRILRPLFIYFTLQCSLIGTR